MTLRTAPSNPQDALEGKVDRIMEIPPLVHTLCEGVRLGYGLHTLVPLTQQAGISGRDVVIRRVIRCTINRCVEKSMLTESELKSWERMSGLTFNTHLAICERQEWVRQQQERLMECRCHPRLDSILRLIHNGKRLRDDQVPWEVIAQAMRLVDDKAWTPEECKKQAPFRTTGRRKKEQISEGQVPDRVVLVATQIVALRQGEIAELAEELRRVLSVVQREQRRLSPYHYRILRELTRILTTRINHEHADDQETYQALLKRAEDLLHPDGPQGEPMGGASVASVGEHE